MKASRSASFVLLLTLLPASRDLAQGMHITVDRCLPPDTAGLTATASGSWECGPYHWSLSGGTITAGALSNTITFTSGPPGTTLTFHVMTEGPFSSEGPTDPGWCYPESASAQAETYPIAQASGGAPVCPGLGARLAGSGGTSCEWTPAEGLDDPHSCTPLASPSATTTYSVVVASSGGCASTNEATTIVTAVPGTDHVLAVERCLPPDTPSLVASVSGGPGESFAWDVSGGTITSGQSTNAITFTSGSPGTSLNVSVAVTGESCGGSLTRRAQLDFADVPPDHLFYGDICAIGRHGITAGCGGGDFCPEAPVRRDQMAVFLLKAKHGESYLPPPCTGIFSDVPCPGPFTDWVEQLKAEGITAGCGDGSYCPDRAVTREQMAAFLLKSKNGPNYTPPSCGGVFGDVPCPSLFADWIEALHAEGVTAGCQASPPLYCPDVVVERGQMAAFLARTFGLE
jgi:hypothetical protein